MQSLIHPELARTLELDKRPPDRAYAASAPCRCPDCRASVVSTWRHPRAERILAAVVRRRPVGSPRADALNAARRS
jgi:hypothetical protein